MLQMRIPKNRGELGGENMEPLASDEETGEFIKYICKTLNEK